MYSAWSGLQVSENNNLKIIALLSYLLTLEIVGNLLVFYSSSDCIDQNPIIYYLCLGYILSMYLMYFFICSLR